MNADERHDGASLTEEAAYWHARLRNENLSEVEAARFRAWVSGNPARRRVFDELTALWDGLDALANSPEVLAEREQIARSASAPEAPPRLRWAAVAGWALAASILAAVALFFWQGSTAPDLYATALGEQRTLPLGDGSVVTLNTSSKLRLRYSSNERRVELLEGQALFEVAKDPNRPFIVNAGGGEVLALGTVFDVYKRSDDDVVVTLIEGRVAVVPERAGLIEAPREGAIEPVNVDAVLGSTLEGRIVLNAGEQVSYGARAAIPVRTPIDTRRAAAWRSRKLDFMDTPLAEAIAEANRYSRVKIELQAPDLEHRPISGVFDAGRNEAFAEGLQSYFGLRLEYRGDDRIVLAHPTH